MRSGHRISTVAMDHPFQQIRAYPDDSYQCDGVIQARVNDEVAAKGRKLRMRLVGMVVMILITSSLIAFGAPDRDAWLPLLGGVFIALFIHSFILALGKPSGCCSGCENPFKKRWVDAIGSGKDLFLVCDRCRRYVYTHLGME